MAERTAMDKSALASEKPFLETPVFFLTEFEAVSAGDYQLIFSLQTMKQRLRSLENVRN